MNNINQDPKDSEYDPLVNFDPRFQARIVFQPTLQETHQGQFCDLCGKIVVQHRWAIVDGLGFVVIACSNIADNHLTLNKSTSEE